MLEESAKNFLCGTPGEISGGIHGRIFEVENSLTIYEGMEREPCHVNEILWEVSEYSEECKEVSLEVKTIFFFWGIAVGKCRWILEELQQTL